MGINIGNFLSSYINSPYIVTYKSSDKDDKVRVALYPHTDASEREEAIIMNDDWKAESMRTYSSPTNIRRVWIGTTGYIVQYYKPIMFKGSLQISELIKHRAYRSNELQNSISKFVKTNQVFLINRNNTANTDLAYRSKDAEPRFSIGGSPFDFITKPWVLSNLEEVYIDPQVLLCDKLINNCAGLFSKIHNINEFEVLASSNQQFANILATLFNVSNARDKKSTINLLSRIEIVKDLDKIINSKIICAKPNNDISIGGPILGNSWIDEENKRRRRNNQPLIQSVSMFNSKPDPEDLKKITVRQMYKFDSEYLVNFSKEIEEKANQIKVEELKKKFEQPEFEKILSEEVKGFLATLKDIEAKSGLGAAKACATIATLRMNKEERDFLIKTLPKIEAARYIQS